MCGRGRGLKSRRAVYLSDCKRLASLGVYLMKVQTIAAIAAIGAALSGCGTIVEGTHQDIAVATSPDGAHCDATRKGEAVGTIDATPGKLSVRKTKDDILLACNKTGYQASSQYLHSGMAAGTFGNIIAGGVIGWGVDSATGADNKYPESVTVQLVPVSGAAAAGAPPPPAVTNSLLPH